MKNYKLIPQIALWSLLALGVIVTILFFAGGSNGSMEVAGDFLNIPKFSNLFLTWNYILIALVCLVTLAVVVLEFVKLFKVESKKAIRALIVVVGFVAVVLLCWFIASPAEVKIIGYEGTDNVGPMAQLSEACLFLTYVLTSATIVALVWGVFHTKCLK